MPTAKELEEKAASDKAAADKAAKSSTSTIAVTGKTVKPDDDEEEEDDELEATETSDLEDIVGHPKLERLSQVLAQLGWTMDDLKSVEWSDKWLRVYDGHDERRVTDNPDA